ncbi:MAG: hypothetical protein KF683_06390 [Rubrivivax sp.]|nr:hypothetical protein [Rubrivivax sp.]
MTANTLPLPPAAAGGWLPQFAAALRTLWRTDRRLVAFALLMLAALLPAALGLALDDRVLRGVNVWVKPMKFMLSVALLALTTAWFARHLPAAVRQGRAYAALGWTLIATGGFEVGYITLQAALGQASHYNVGSVFHGVMYTLMGAGAIALTATQPWLAWLLWRHGEPLPRAYRQAVLLGLVLTFVLGAGAGILLGDRQPPTGPGLPLLGWSMVGGDLRVAHFVGIHAEQALPLLAAGLLAWRPRIAVAGVWAGTAALSALWAAVLVQALQGRPLLAL